MVKSEIQYVFKWRLECRLLRMRYLGIFSPVWHPILLNICSRQNHPFTFSQPTTYFPIQYFHIWYQNGFFWQTSVIHINKDISTVSLKHLFLAVITLSSYHLSKHPHTRPASNLFIVTIKASDWSLTCWPLTGQSVS